MDDTTRAKKPQLSEIAFHTLQVNPKVPFRHIPHIDYYSDSIKGLKFYHTHLDLLDKPAYIGKCKFIYIDVTHINAISNEFIDWIIKYQIELAGSLTVNYMGKENIKRLPKHLTRNLLIK